MNKAILEGKEIKLVNDLIEWATWFEKANRHVAQTMIGEVKVSTVFLGLDHGWDGKTPLWFETMIFGGPHDGYMNRYSTWDEAEAGHKRAVYRTSVKYQ